MTGRYSTINRLTTHKTKRPWDRRDVLRRRGPWCLPAVTGTNRRVRCGWPEDDLEQSVEMSLRLRLLRGRDAGISFDNCH